MALYVDDDDDGHHHQLSAADEEKKEHPQQQQQLIARWSSFCIPSSVDGWMDDGRMLLPGLFYLFKVRQCSDGVILLALHS